MKPEKVLIVYNAHNPLASDVLPALKEYLQIRGIQCDCLSYHSNEGRKPLPGGPHDLAVTLGGDGTFLYCAGLLVEETTPILPINAGKLGFISEVGLDEWKNGLDRVLAGDCLISERAILEILVIRNDHEVALLHGLNEAVVHSGIMARIIRLDLMLDKIPLGQIRGDGLIIATPMGSTAYSLAAGGPIVDPEMSALLLTPICPFSLSFRPLVLSGDATVSITVTTDQRTNIHLTVDGQKVFPLEPGDRLQIKQSANPVRVILSEKRNFYQVVRMKLGWLGGVDA
jgi:NAD+ kinase